MSDPQFELSFDVLFVGAGPASLASAYHLKQLINKHNEENPGNQLADIMIGVFEKGASAGDHVLSGAVLDPGVLDEFMPEWRDTDIPVKSKITKDDMYFLTQNGQFRLPIAPPGMENKGNYVISLSELTKWLAKKCESAGVDIFTSEPVKDIIYSGEGSVIGIKTADKGLDKEGKQKSNYMPGAEIGAKVLVIGEGSRGFITQKLADKFNLNQNCNTQNYVTGIKELWEVKPENFSPGYVMHTFGYPADFKTYGGGFVYHLRDNIVALGYAVGLDYANPHLNIQEEAQKFKTHPLVKKILEGAAILEYGAKTISEGGYYSIGKLSGGGFMIIGEGAGFLNSKRLKGIHLAIKSGMLAAQVIFKALKEKIFSADLLSDYDKKVKDSWINKELYSVRNFHQGFKDGTIAGMIHTGFQTVTGGRGLIDKFKVEKDCEHLKKLSEYSPSPLAGEGRGGGCAAQEFKPDKVITFDRLTEVFYSAVKHEENQPNHLKVKDLNICNGKCFTEYGNPCTKFCPGQVYEIEEISNKDNTVGADPCVCPSGNKVQLKMNPSNCLHCKTCEIKDPYEQIEWTPPEGGGGPGYKRM